jgi:hypothetical protein
MTAADAQAFTSNANPIGSSMVSYQLHQTRLRAFATYPAFFARARTSESVPRLNLSNFLLHQRVIALWRDVVRTTNEIPKSAPTRREMKDFAREEFERNKGVDDPVQIRYLVSTGKMQLDQIRKQWRF